MIEMTQALFGQNARHVPCWMYVQDVGDGIVSFVGASHVGEGTHPLRYGSERTHQFIVGEMIARPHFVVATDTLRGMGLAALASHHHDIGEMLAEGERIAGALPS